MARRALGLKSLLKVVCQKDHSWSRLNSALSFGTSQHVFRDEIDRDVSRFPVPDRSSLDADIQERMDVIEGRSGFLPNVFKALSYRPEEFRAFFNYYDALMEKEGNLSKAEKELIVVVTSAANRCHYCVVAHSALHRIYAKNPILADQVAINWRTADLNDREKAIVEFAMDVCDAKPITEEHFMALEMHGFNSDDAWDIGAIAAFFALSNRMAYLANMKPNKEFYTIGRIPRDKKS